MGFDCGKPLLSDWIRHLAGQFEKRDLARVYVAVHPGQPRVFGYYSISNTRLLYEELPAQEAKRLPRNLDIPAALIGRLAVDRVAQGQKLGNFLLIDALRRIQYLASQIGILATVVEGI